MRFNRAIGAAAAATLGAAGLAVVGLPAAHAVTDPIDIRVEQDLPYSSLSEGPRVFEVLGVAAGADPELTEADEVANPSGWVGNVLVDVDPDARTITVEVENRDGYGSIIVAVTSDEIASVGYVSGEIFRDPDLVTRSVSVADGVSTLSWEQNEPGLAPGLLAGGAAVFSYEVFEQFSVDPAEDEPGRIVALSGGACAEGNEVFGSVTLDGVDVAEVAAETSADGFWSTEVDTTGFADGTYTVAVTCAINGDPIFDYAEGTFVLATDVIEDEVSDETETPDETDETDETDQTATPDETETPDEPGDGIDDSDDGDEAPAAQPVTAEPTFTG